MLKSLLVGWLKGLHIRTEEARLVIDSNTSHLPRDAIALISHAHADHTQGFNSPNVKISTYETKRIFETLTGREVKNFRELSLNSSLKIGDMEVEALNSGHVIGAAQFKISTPEASILYTGDVNYVDSLIGEAAEPEECDLLVTEATYGVPIYSFPSRTKIYSDIVMWALDEVKHGRTPCFRVYATGKAQEIVKLFNKYTSVPVFSDRSINSVNEICNDERLKLIWEAAESEPANSAEPLIYVTSRRHYVGRDFSEARATGWALRMRRTGVEAFPLSGHADFNQLSKFVEDTGAERVYIFTGFVKEFSEYLRRKGLEAGPIPPISQRELLEFT